MSKTKQALDVASKLRSLADSIENLVGAIEADESVPAKQEAAKIESSTTEPEPKQPTLEELRAFMATKNKDGHREKVKAILQRYGANKLTALDSKHYIQVLKEVEEIK